MGRLARAPSKQRLGGLLQAPVRWSPAGAQVPRPIHPSCRHLQSAAGLPRRRQGHFPLQGLLKWTPFFGPRVKVVGGACSFMKEQRKNERKTHETQPGLQGEGCLGGPAGAGDGAGALAAAPSSREPDLQVEASAFGEHRAGLRGRRGQWGRWERTGVRALAEDRRADGGEGFFITRARSLPVKGRWGLVEANAEVSMRRQCELLGLNRSSLYYEAVEPDADELGLMRRIEELHREHPFLGSRMGP